MEEYFQDTDLFLVEVRELPKDRIQVVVDSDSGLNIDTCAKISRYLESHLEQEGLVREHYNLEVSSPGVGKPLQMLRQYRNNVGRRVEVRLDDERKVSGRLKAVDEAGIEVEPMAPKKGKKKPAKKVQTPEGPQRILFDRIKETKVLVSF